MESKNCLHISYNNCGGYFAGHNELIEGASFLNESMIDYVKSHCGKFFLLLLNFIAVSLTRVLNYFKKTFVYIFINLTNKSPNVKLYLDITISFVY